MNKVNSQTLKKGVHRAAPPFSGYVVGIGASAGGLEALEQFFDHCPADTGAVFVVIQHLSPDHKSMMNNLLARHTRMPVVMVEDGMQVQANQVFLIPPGSIMRVSSGQFHLSPKSPHGLTLPIDIFFTTLSEAYGSYALGVVLSGTGSDGTRGAVAINAAGGFLLAQDPEQAKFDGMPRSVIATGVVDEVLHAQQLGARIQLHIHNLPFQSPIKAIDAPSNNEALSSAEAIQALLQLLKQTGGINFQEYKSGTVMRRIERRMQVRHIPTINAYLDLLEEDRTELFVLRRELLISVTSFFRDPESFDVVAEKAVATLVANASSSDAIRVWTAGVSTGEEAYTLAMLFMEAFERERRWPNLKIFATDVNQQNIEVAAQGQYPESAAAELTPARLERFFVKNGSHFVVKPELRQSIVFAKHNLLDDPPFTRMDLVSCRNTLIYFRTDAQERAQRRLQYAVKPEGFLFLGSSESLAGATTAFANLSVKHKLFKRTAGVVPLVYESPHTTPSRVSYIGGKPLVSVTNARTVPSDGPIIEAGLSALMSAYTPPAILVNDRHEAVHLFGDLQPFFRVREGLASLDINRILPDPLVPVASALVFKSAKDGSKLVSDLLHVDLGGGNMSLLRLAAHPLKLHGEERFVLLCFERTSDNAEQGRATPINVDAETMARVDVLERELMATRESLQATIEELETSNEELQATNEEMMASNEELQSSNEELQSVNEELNTVNSEFQEKTAILSRLNSDMDSMTKAVGVATVFVDHELNLTRFSPDALDLFKLRNSDVGRPLDDIAHKLKYTELMSDIRRTLMTDRMFEREVMTEEGRLYLCRLLPYRVPSTQQHGVVATFVDVTVFRDLRRLQSIIDALPENIAVLEQDGKISMVNAAWRNFARANGDSNLSLSGPGSNYFAACGTTGGDGLPCDDDYAQRAVRGVRGVLEGTLPQFSLQYPCHSPTEKRWFVMSVTRVVGHEFGAVVSHFNISDWYTPHTAPKESGHAA
ncbi:MAG: PAS domain-containing protein [Burkholderiaceae bacterium]|nr:PAS domain-containing protein [Burkholderiaceae bacterium]